MKTMTVADFKTNFSAVLKEVESGEKIAITYGRKKERVLGAWEGKVTAVFKGGHNTTEKEFYGMAAKKYFKQ